jgi:hypothetical protein
MLGPPRFLAGRTEQQLLNQPITRDNPVRAQQQQRQQRTLPRPTHRHRDPIRANLQRPQNPELQSENAHRPSNQVSYIDRFLPSPPTL